MPPTEVTFRLSPRYSIHNALEAHAWFLEMMREHEEFEVETDRAGLLCLASKKVVGGDPATGRVARAVTRPGPLRSEHGDFHHSAPPLKQSHGARGPFGPPSGQNAVAV